MVILTGRGKDRCKFRAPFLSADALAALGEQLALVEIRLATGLLLIGPPSSFPKTLRNAGDQLRRHSALKGLWDDSGAVRTIRARWTDLFPGSNPTLLTEHDLHHRFDDAVRHRKLRTVFLPATKRGLDEVETEGAEAKIVRIETGNGTWLVGSPRHMPPSMAQCQDISPLLAWLDGASRDRKDGWQVAHQARRVLPAKQAAGTNQQLASRISQRLKGGQLIAVRLDTKPQQRRADAIAPIPTDVGKMSVGDKLMASLMASAKHLPKEMSHALLGMLVIDGAIFAAKKAAQTEMVAFISGLVALGFAQLFPGVNVAVDGLLIYALWGLIGYAAIDAVSLLADAVIEAVQAQSPEDIERAGAAFAKVLALIGVAGFAAMKAKFIETKGSAGAAEEARTSASSGAAKRGPSPNAAEAESANGPKQLSLNKPDPAKFTGAGSKPVRTLPGKANKVAVIGRSMGDGTGPGVRSYAKAFENAGGQMETFDGPQISDSARREWQALTNGGNRHLSPAELKQTKIYQENLAWAKKLKDQGYTIVDLGSPESATPSEFYEMEKQVIFGD